MAFDGAERLAFAWVVELLVVVEEVGGGGGTSVEVLRQAVREGGVEDGVMGDAVMAVVAVQVVASDELTATAEEGEVDEVGIDEPVDVGVRGMFGADEVILAGVAGEDATGVGNAEIGGGVWAVGVGARGVTI